MPPTHPSPGEAAGFMAPEEHATLLKELQTLVAEYLDGLITIESRLWADGSIQLYANHSIRYETGINIDGAISPVQENERIIYDQETDTFVYQHFTEFTHRTEGKRRTVLEKETVADHVLESFTPGEKE